MGRFDRLPGLSDSNTTRRNVVVGGMYGLAGCMAVGALAGDGSDGDENSAVNGEDEPEAEDEPEGENDPEEEDEPEGENDPEEEGSPSFEITNVDHPDEVETGEEHNFTIEVENTGDAAGDFTGRLEFSVGGQDGYENLGDITIEDIDPGETATWESGSAAYDQPTTVQYRLGDTEWEYDVTTTAPEPQSFSGSGQTVEEGVSIQGGLVVVEGSHDGESNFQVSLAGDSEYDDNFINAIGSFDGTQAGLIEGGDYLLDVNADGSWEVTIRQPRSGQGESLPASFSGNSPDVVGPVQFGGTGIATGSHDGDSNYQVQIFPATGSFGEIVFNEIGEFEGETTFSFDGVGWVDVNANGSWVIELE